MLVRFSCRSQHAPINLQWKQQNLRVKEQPWVQELRQPCLQCKGEAIAQPYPTLSELPDHSG